MAPTNPHSPDLPSGGRVTGAGHHRPTPNRRPPSGAHSRLSSPSAAGHAVAEPAITVVVPSDPPILTPDVATVLLRILLRGADRGPTASAPDLGGGRTSATPVHLGSQQSRRAL
jgi:hypothetical protein